MKRTIAAIALGCAALFNAESAQAQGLDINKYNSNAVAETFVRTVLADAGVQQNPNPYIDTRGISLICTGKIPTDKFQTFDKTGRPTIYPAQSKLAEFLGSTDVKDKNAQAALGDLVAKRSDLAYLQYTAVGGPTAEHIKTYIGKIGGKVHDAFAYGTGVRDGSATTTVLIDKATLDKFAAANKAGLDKQHAYFTSRENHVASWTACGPAAKK